MNINVYASLFMHFLMYNKVCIEGQMKWRAMIKLCVHKPTTNLEQVVKGQGLHARFCFLFSSLISDAGRPSLPQHELEKKKD
eukprot:c39394_g1_i1 orf=149-394(-)